MNIQEILRLSQDGLYEHILSFLREHEIAYEHTSQHKWIFVKGNAPVLLVAHLDTVHQRPPRKILQDEEQSLLWSPDGIGGDDRCGVFAILTILLDMPKEYLPSVLFTTDEETGGWGVQDFMKAYPAPPVDLRYIVELDRAGDDDCVFYNCDNPEFEKYVQKFAFKQAYGSFTDISFLAPKWKIAAVNLSCGYYNPHTCAEFINIDVLYYTIARVESMIKDSVNVPMFKYIPLSYKGFFPESADPLPLISEDEGMRFRRPMGFCVGDQYITVLADKDYSTILAPLTDQQLTELKKGHPDLFDSYWPDICLYCIGVNCCQCPLQRPNDTEGDDEE